MTTPRAVVIGIGNEFRSDDGVGPAVAARLEKLDLPGVLVIASDGDPAELLDVWSGVELAIVVDAVCCEPSVPGRILRTDAELFRRVSTTASSHTLGIPDALPLGRVLGRAPGELVVIAVEAACLDLGAGLSEPVAAAVPRVVETVLTELRRVEPAVPPHRVGLT